MIIIAFPPSANCNRSLIYSILHFLIDCCIIEFSILPTICTASVLLCDRAELTRTKHHFDRRYKSHNNLIWTTKLFSAVYYSKELSNIIWDCCSNRSLINDCCLGINGLIRYWRWGRSLITDYWIGITQLIWYWRWGQSLITYYFIAVTELIRYWRWGRSLITDYYIGITQLIRNWRWGRSLITDFRIDVTKLNCYCFWVRSLWVYCVLNLTWWAFYCCADRCELYYCIRGRVLWGLSVSISRSQSTSSHLEHSINSLFSVFPCWLSYPK